VRLEYVVADHLPTRRIRYVVSLMQQGDRVYMQVHYYAHEIRPSMSENAKWSPHGNYYDESVVSGQTAGEFARPNDCSDRMLKAADVPMDQETRRHILTHFVQKMNYAAFYAVDGHTGQLGVVYPKKG
jgi:hypothetical protein